MTRRQLAALLGLEVAVAGVLVMLAGSDIPPPPGFVFVGVAAVGLGILIGLLLPRLLARCDEVGAIRGALVLVAPTAGYLVGLAGFATALGTGEPSGLRPTALDAAILVVVAALVGVSVGAVVTVVAVLVDRVRSNRGRALLMAILLPALIAGLPIMVILAVR